MSDAITSFELAIADQALEDLGRGLRSTRWPEPLHVRAVRTISISMSAHPSAGAPRESLPTRRVCRRVPRVERPPGRALNTRVGPRWAGRHLSNIIHWNELDRYVNAIRNCSRTLHQ